jgi:hypothetical protein
VVGDVAARAIITMQTDAAAGALGPELEASSNYRFVLEAGRPGLVASAVIVRRRGAEPLRSATVTVTLGEDQAEGIEPADRQLDAPPADAVVAKVMSRSARDRRGGPATVHRRWAY